jgi:antitoxin PrlF
MPYQGDTTLTVKGQVTIPAEIRERMDLQPGDKLRFSLTESGKLTVEPRRRRSIFDSLGSLKLPALGRPLEQADIDDAITEAMTDQERRSRRLKP